MHNQTSILVSVPEFAARTSLSARHVWRLIREHKIPSHRVGRRRVIPLDPAVEALMANHTSRVAPKSEIMQMAWIPIISDGDWPSIHGTEKPTKLVTADAVCSAAKQRAPERNKVSGRLFMIFLRIIGKRDNDKEPYASKWSKLREVQ